MGKIVASCDETGPGTGMFQAMQAVVRRIPKGKVATYGQIAALAGFPGAARQAAWSLRHSGGRLPWHRVLGARGRILLAGESGLEQLTRLRAEGVTFKGGRVDLLMHQWRS